ncbi:nitrate- and nitrite sensing domain-containing protein [Sphaerisporangium sp. NPDC005288]|uniref:nitrate- and nitrite sensing domain-containing protein n=1 Tax=Sphaerisporangium sp. NPDC005288 TaxID=3155114 RepID=UPI0033B74D1C
MMDPETKTAHPGAHPEAGTGAKRRRHGGGQAGQSGPGGQYGQHSQHGQRARRGPGRLAPRNWRVPARLTALILVPTLVGVLLAGLRVVSSIDGVAAYQRNAAEATIAAHLRELSLQLGLERDRSVWFQTTRQQRAALLDQRGAVDAAISKVRGDLGTIDSEYGVRAVQDAQQVKNRLDTMPVIRKGGQAAKYTDIVSSLLRLHDEIIQSSEDPQLVGDLRGLSALAHAKEEASQQRGTLIGTLARGQRFTADKLEDFIAARSRQKSAVATFSGEAGADNGRLLSSTLVGEQAIRAELTKSWAIALASRNLPVQANGARGPAAVKQWFDDSTKTIDLFQRVENQVAATVAARASALESAERRNAIIAGVLILALILLVLATTVLIARSLVRPLRRLRSEALEIAGFRLPAVVRRMRESGDVAEASDVQPIVVGTNDEIGEVASAFDEVHRQALRLAAEESQLRGNVNAMFVNLSRRIQTLVERQISLIDGLERGEQDGSRLADLFKLDHLATRMRRNSENLLVLAGHEAARKRSQPAKLVDVVRASLSEVEDYERVSVKVHRNAAIAGHAANDVVHLVAELVENALAFSPGNTRVVVSSSMIEGGGALLAVSDSGIGMTVEEITETNRKLADPPVVDVSVSRRMGLFVVGRLALRHDIRVQLRRGDAAGLIAMVLFPPQLISVAAGRGPVLPQRGAAQETPSPAFGGSDLAANGAYGGGEPFAAFNGRGAQPAAGAGPLTNGATPPPSGGGPTPPPNGTGPYSSQSPFQPFRTGAGAAPVGGDTPASGSRLSAFGGPAPAAAPGGAGPVPAGPGRGQGARDDEPLFGAVRGDEGAFGAGRGDEAAFGPVGPSTGPSGPSGPVTPPVWPTEPAGSAEHAGPSTDSSGPFAASAGPSTGAAGTSAGPATGPAGSAGPFGRPAGPSTGLPVRAPGRYTQADPPTAPFSPGLPPADASGLRTGAGASGAHAGPAGPRTGPLEPDTGPAGPSGPRTGPSSPSSPSGSSAPAGPRTAPPVPAESLLEHGDEFLPIFAALESAWFRRPDPHEIAAARGQAPAGQAAGAETARPEDVEEPLGYAEQESGTWEPEAREPGRREAVLREAGLRETEPPAAGAAAWGSTADSGWQAADAAKEPSLGGVTAAGLPKRTPKANLVPGSVAGPSASAAAPPLPSPQVSADQVRARMSRFQQGIQRGRADITEASRTTDNDNP